MPDDHDCYTKVLFEKLILAFLLVFVVNGG
jgi:hypothetical protein